MVGPGTLLQGASVCDQSENHGSWVLGTVTKRAENPQYMETDEQIARREKAGQNGRPRVVPLVEKKDIIPKVRKGEKIPFPEGEKKAGGGKTGDNRGGKNKSGEDTSGGGSKSGGKNTSSNQCRRRRLQSISSRREAPQIHSRRY